jgi:hypothetical protein
MMLFLQNEANKCLFINGLQFANPAESQILRDERVMSRVNRAITDLQGPGTSREPAAASRLKTVANLEQVGAEAMEQAQGKGKPPRLTVC